MDKNEFFRKATLAICGDLRIEESMRNCTGIIGKLIPIDRMYLLLYEPDIR